MIWTRGWLPCPHCCYPYHALSVWTGAREACVACGELLRPGRATRVVERGETLDVVECPWCGAEQRWRALERVGLVERRQRVRYQCGDCLRPFTVEHDPTASGAVNWSEFTERERAWLEFVRSLLDRGRVEP